MNIERKFIDLKSLKVSDEGPGTIEGYRSVHSEIDEGGDLVVKGFFADSIPEYLDAGFSAHSHEWAFKDAVGFPIEAREDDHGFFVKSQFHSTDDAQDIRQKAKERMEAGKRVGFSFGYSVTDKSYIEAKDYKEQIPLYVKPERLAANLLKAQQFDRIRILKKGEVIEDSIVTAPMNKLAMATGVKSEPPKITVDVRVNENEFANAITAHIVGNAKSNAECDCLPESGDDCPHKSNSNLKEMPGTESFESFESVESALKKFTQQMQRNHENRVKEGRILSSSNRAKVVAARDALDELLAASEPPPKEKEIDVDALRTQSLRMQSLAIRALA